MKHEAKFSVVLPGGNYASAEIETFEQLVKRYKLPVNLPLSSDPSGNIVIASSMSLREAQILRRQVAELGYPADCVSDASEGQFLGTGKDGEIFEDGDLDLDGIPSDSIAEMASEAWESLEVPELDLGLTDGDDVTAASNWNGDNWLDPDTNAIPEDIPTKDRTLGVSANELFVAAQQNGGSQNSLNAANILGNSGSDKKSKSSTTSSDLFRTVNEEGGYTDENKTATFSIPKDLLGILEKMEPGKTPSPAEIEEMAAKEAEAAQSEDMPAVSDDSSDNAEEMPAQADDAAVKTVVTTSQTDVPAVKPADKTAAKRHAKTDIEEPPAVVALQPASAKKTSPAVIFAWVLVLLVIICLVLAIYYTYVDPKDVLTPLLKAIF